MSRAIVLAVALVATSISGCRQLRSDADERAKRAGRAEGNIVVGVVWPSASEKDGFIGGVQLAAEQVNAAGGILGRQLELVVHDDEGSIVTGKLVAQELAENLDLVAVVGHKQADVAMVTSIIYEYYNVVLLCPGSTSRRLARDGFRRVFRFLPTDAELGAHLADYAQSSGYRRVLLAYANDTHGRALANGFESRAEEHRVRIVDRLAYDEGGVRSFERGLEALGDTPIDAIVLGARTADAVDILSMIRGRGEKAPVLGAIGLDSRAFADTAGGLADGAVVVSVFDSTIARPEVRTFVRAHEKKYERPPDTWAAQGYDAVKILAEAMTVAKGTNPQAVSDTLRTMVDWRGVTGMRRFSPKGELVRPSVVFKRVTRGRFELVQTSTRT